MPFPWDKIPASCMPESCFCERIRDEIPYQFANTYSSIFFIFFAGLIIYRYFRHSENFKNRYRFFEFPHRVYLYSFSLFLTGIGSIYFHAGLSFAGQVLDVTGMNFLAIFIFLYHFERIFGLEDFYKKYFILNSVFLVLLIFVPELRRYLFGLIILFSILLISQDNFKIRFLFSLFQNKKNLPQGFLLEPNETSPAFFPNYKLDKKYFRISLILISIAFLVWILDLTKIVCKPDSLFQGHAIWHFLGSISAFYLYLYYESEKI